MPLPWGCHWETVAVTVSALCIRCQQQTRECESGGEVGEILPLLPGQLRCWAGAEEDQGAQEAGASHFWLQQSPWAVTLGGVCRVMAA